MSVSGNCACERTMDPVIVKKGLPLNQVPTMPDKNPQIEEILHGKGVIPLVCKEIQIDARAPKQRERLISLGVKSETDFEMLLKRLHGPSVSYRERVLLPWDEIADAAGASLSPELHFEGSQAVLLLVDPYPGANWGHPCWIATFDLDNGRIRKVLNDFPPRESADRRMVRLPALPALG